MDEIIDLIATDSSASEVTSKIKDVLFSKSAKRIDAQRPDIAASMVGDNQPEPEVQPEPEQTEE